VKLGIRTIKLLGGLTPNVLVLGFETWQVLQDHPTLVDRIKFVSDQMISQQIAARLLGVERIVVADAVKATNAVGQPDSYAFVHGRHALLAYASANPGPLSPSAGYVFSWVGVNNGSSVAVKVIDKPLTDSVRYEAEVSWAAKITGAQLGFFYADAV